MLWLLEPQVRERLENAFNSKLSFSADQIAQFEARSSMRGDRGPRILTVAGDKAEIAIEGVLTKKPDILAAWFGGGNTTYADIIEAIAVVEQDDDVKEIVLAVDGPGGEVDGMFDAIAAIQSAKKPIRTVVTGVAASASYGIASQGETIVATSRGSRIGSIGVAAALRIREDEVEITSTEAPNKRPNPQTKEGQDAIREELDAIHDLFVESIATGRGTTVKKVNADFGRGSVLLADEALSRGMIDSISGPALNLVASSSNSKTANSGGESTEAVMDLNELKAKHPDVYQAAADEGRSEGEKQERDRVVAHLTLGEASGAMNTAVTAIQEGSEMTASLQAKYLAAGMNKSDVDGRDEDSTETSSATEGTDTAVASEERDKKASASLLNATFEALGVEQPTA